MSVAWCLVDELQVAVGGQDEGKQGHAGASDEGQDRVEPGNALADEHDAGHYGETDHQTPARGIWKQG